MGTSLAAPHVAGVVALMKSVDPDLTPADARRIIKETATPVRRSLEHGSGIVNASRALHEVLLQK